MTKPATFRFEPGAIYRNGVAVITTATRMTEVHVDATAGLYIDGFPVRATKTDALALSLGYRALATEVDRLQAELKAARAGTMGKEHAEAMQGARKVIAEVSHAASDFLDVYDQGEAPDGVQLRDTLGNAELWLLSDVKACGERAKILEGDNRWEQHIGRAVRQAPEGGAA